MSLFDHLLNILDGLISNFLNTLVFAPIFFEVKLRSWVLAVGRLVFRLFAIAFHLPTHALASVRARFRPSKPAFVNTAIAPSAAPVILMNAPPVFPAGTASAIATAMQPPVSRSPLPNYVNNTAAMHWAYAHEDLERRARAEMATAYRSVRHFL